MGIFKKLGQHSDREEQAAAESSAATSKVTPAVADPDDLVDDMTTKK
jgi:hypothetical protein